MCVVLRGNERACLEGACGVEGRRLRTAVLARCGRDFVARGAEGERASLVGACGVEGLVVHASNGGGCEAEIRGGGG